MIGRDDTIFPEGDQKALAGILKTLILSDEKRRELSEYGIERVKANYTFERIAEQLSEIYESIRRRPKEKKTMIDRTGYRFKLGILKMIRLRGKVRISIFFHITVAMILGAAFFPGTPYAKDAAAKKTPFSTYPPKATTA